MSAKTTTTDVRQHILEVGHPLLLRKGFTGVGLAEVLAAAQVPKGSFYHYFSSKEAFGQAILETYFEGYLKQMDELLAPPGRAAERLIRFFQNWLDSQTSGEAQRRCLVVKLSAEVCDLSESMRTALQRGTRDITERLALCIEAGVADGSVAGVSDPQGVGLTLYQNWLGASLLAKITRDRAPLDMAMANTRELFGLA